MKFIARARESPEERKKTLGARHLWQEHVTQSPPSLCTPHRRGVTSAPLSRVDTSQYVRASRRNKLSGGGGIVHATPVRRFPAGIIPAFRNGDLAWDRPRTASLRSERAIERAVSLSLTRSQAGRKRPARLNYSTSSVGSFVGKEAPMTQQLFRIERGRDRLRQEYDLRGRTSS